MVCLVGRLRTTRIKQRRRRRRPRRSKERAKWHVSRGSTHSFVALLHEVYRSLTPFRVDVPWMRQHCAHACSGVVRRHHQQPATRNKPRRNPRRPKSSLPKLRTSAPHPRPRPPPPPTPQLPPVNPNPSKPSPRETPHLHKGRKACRGVAFPSCPLRQSLRPRHQVPRRPRPDRARLTQR